MVTMDPKRLPGPRRCRKAGRAPELPRRGGQKTGGSCPKLTTLSAAPIGGETFATDAGLTGLRLPISTGKRDAEPR
jgi:hypothetical protein